MIFLHAGLKLNFFSIIQDLALTIVGGLYQYFLDKRRQHMTLLVGKCMFPGLNVVNLENFLKFLRLSQLLIQA